MAKIIIESNCESEPRRIPMSEMQPGDVGFIVISSSKIHTKGNLVMRTLSTHKFEVMDLTQGKADKCWINEETLLTVELLKPGEEVHITLRGE